MAQRSRCAAPGCLRGIDSDRLMCWHHWSLVPRAQQQVVYRTWRAWQHGPTEMAADRWEAYMVARKAAIDSLTPAPAGKAHWSTEK